MISLLREHGIDYKTSNGKMSYNITNVQLRDIGNKFKLFFDDDAEEIEENRIVKVGGAVKLVVEPTKLLAEIERLNKIIEELKQVKAVVMPVDNDETEIEVINTNINM